MFNIVYKSDKFGVYLDEECCMYVSTKYIKDENKVYTYALTASDHKPNYILSKINLPNIKLLKECYHRGNIKFENGKCKFIINNYFMFDIG